jgi:hypothetical protein
MTHHLVYYAWTPATFTWSHSVLCTWDKKWPV